MNKDYAERLQRFKELRIAQQSEKPIKKDKTNRRTQSAGRCSFAGMTCFRINRNRWLTKPTWDGKKYIMLDQSVEVKVWDVGGLDYNLPAVHSSGPL